MSPVYTEGRFTPAALTKTNLNVVLNQASGGKPPFPTAPALRLPLAGNALEMTLKGLFESR